MSTVDKDTDIEVDQEVYRLFTKLFFLLDDYDRRFFAEHGLSARQFWALQHLDMLQGRSMVDLSRLLFTDKSNVTGIVDHLEHLKFVTRTPDSHDRRVILITLTSTGLCFREAVNEQHRQHIRTMTNVVAIADQHSLLNHLQAISHNIEVQLGQPDGT